MIDCDCNYWSLRLENNNKVLTSTSIEPDNLMLPNVWRDTSLLGWVFWALESACYEIDDVGNMFSN